MSLGSGNNNEGLMLAYNKRKAQLERWRESDTEKETLEGKTRPSRVKFADQCIFQAACAANDKALVAKMIKDGYDINAVDEDGITALHQACIKDNLEMVEFLLKHGADVNISDNEGWTPLHAVATCCYVSVARVLLESGANVVALNNDCSIPLDICESDEIREIFIQHINAKGIDLKEARRGEEIKMADDAKRWLASGYSEEPHPITGATALHVAACKGYIKILEQIVKSGADINMKDFDGWTPLHAASHWGHKEACEILLENDCDLTFKDNSGQTALDVADRSCVSIIEQYKKKREMNKSLEKLAPAVINVNKPTNPVIQIQANSLPNTNKPVTPVIQSQSAVRKVENHQNHTNVPRKVEKENQNHTGAPRKNEKENQNHAPATPTARDTKSFVPPARDEESETQRKAHAKRVRETRRSTQGVTLEELKSAEQYAKNSLLGNTAPTTEQTSTPAPIPTPVPASTSSAPVSTSVSTSIPTQSADPNFRKDEDTTTIVERRPSWRLRVDKLDPSKFSLEDTRSTPQPIKDSSGHDIISVQRSSSLRSRTPAHKHELGVHGKPPKPPDGTEKQGKTQQEEEKEKDMKNSGAGAQGAILRKKKTKRRSTGIVQYNQDGSEISQAVSGSDAEVESGSGRSSDQDLQQDSANKSENGVNSTINYKKLYEEVLKENQLLKSRLTRAEEDVADLKIKLERVSITPRISSDDMDRREKRALERKLSEMEEELKQIQKLKLDNEKLKAENRALTRVVSKLSGNSGVVSGTGTGTPTGNGPKA